MLLRLIESSSHLTQRELACEMDVSTHEGPETLGKQVRERAVDLLKRDWVSVLATAAHNREHRPPELEPSRKAAPEIVGEPESWNLVRGTPLSILGIAPNMAVVP